MIFLHLFFMSNTHLLAAYAGDGVKGGSQDVLYDTLDGKAPYVECQDCGRDDEKPQLALDATALKEHRGNGADGVRHRGGTVD